jgi:hypothetical protein
MEIDQRAPRPGPPLQVERGEMPASMCSRIGSNSAAIRSCASGPMPPRDGLIPLAGGQLTWSSPVAAATWHPRTGVLQATGPLQNVTSPTDRARPCGSTPWQATCASKFYGFESQYRLPTRAAKALLEAQRTIWNLAEHLLASDHLPGPYRSLAGERRSLPALIWRRKPRPSQACRVLQSGDQLSANQCVWQWPTGQIEAQGSVLLRRRANRQITRAERLQGQIGKNGLAVFSSPGSLVRSQLTLPAPGGNPPGRSRPAAPPVTF